jgi:hypothetical protein
MTPLAVFGITVGLGSLGIGRDDVAGAATSAGKAFGVDFFARDGIGVTMALSVIQAALAGMVYMASGASAGEAARHSTSVMAGGFQDTTLRLQQHAQQRNRMRGEFYNSAPMVALDHMRSGDMWR